MGKASTKAQNKYINKKYDRINLVVEKGKKETIKTHADVMGESLNAFINRAIDETIKNDKEDLFSPLFNFPPGHHSTRLVH